MPRLLPLRFFIDVFQEITGIILNNVLIRDVGGVRNPIECPEHIGVWRKLSEFFLVAKNVLSMRSKLLKNAFVCMVVVGVRAEMWRHFCARLLRIAANCLHLCFRHAVSALWISTLQ